MGPMASDRPSGHFDQHVHLFLSDRSMLFQFLACRIAGHICKYELQPAGVGWGDFVQCRVLYAQGKEGVSWANCRGRSTCFRVLRLSPKKGGQLFCNHLVGFQCSFNVKVPVVKMNEGFHCQLKPH